MKNKNRKALKLSLADLKKDELRVLASDIRADILSTCFSNGGHLSSNLGVVEVTLSMLKNIDPEKNDILFDVGHQSYAYKMLTDRDISKIRIFNGVAPFNLREESAYDVYSNGHAGDSISTAIGIAKAKLLSHDESYTVAFVGDASIENGLSLEGLDFLAANKDLKNLIIVLNDNGMAISKNKGALSSRFSHLRNSRFYFRTSNKLGSSMAKHKLTWKLFLKLRGLKDRLKAMFIRPTLFETWGIKYIGPFDGHDFDSLDLAFEKAKIVSLKQPVILHVITKKGYGFPEAMKDEMGSFHGVGSHYFEKERKDDDFSKFKEESLVKMMEEDEKIVLITPAMEKGSHLEKAFKMFPERCIDTGISEEHAIVMASGLALENYSPIVDIYSTFLQRGYDEILENISRNKVKTTFVVERCGLVGEDGSSHHGIYDVAMARSIPYSHVYMPFDVFSMKEVFKLIDEIDYGPIFIRFPKGKVEENKNGYSFKKDVAYLSYKQKKKLILAIGPMGYQLLKKIDSEYDKIMLVNLLPSLEILDSLNLSSYDEIYLFDPYSIKEGTASLIACYLNKQKYQGDYFSYSLDNEFVTFGNNSSLYSSLGLDIDTVIENISTKGKDKGDN